MEIYSDLDNKINDVMNYIKNKNMNDRLLRNYLFDALTRYKIKIKYDKPLIYILKQFYTNKECIKRYDEIVSKFNLEKMLDENCKLLLRECIYLEKFIYQA